METLAPQQTYAEQVYRAILDAICDGRLEPGERLTQDSVAQKLNVSRQPVGQALLLLKQQKFVCEAGRRGLMVAPLDRDFLRWVYELRLGLDPLAASLAARQAKPKDVEQGQRLIEAGRRASAENSIPALIGADMDFHMFVYELSGNLLLVETMAQYWNHLRRAMREVLQNRAYRKAIWIEHGHILRAIAKGDPDAAASLSAQHLRGATQTLEIFLPGTSLARPGGAAGMQRL